MALKTKTPRKEAETAASEAAPVAEAQGPAPLRIKELVERVGAKSALKRKELREVTDMVLAELGTALAAGTGLSLPGLGHVKVTRKGDNGVVTLRMRPISADAAQKKGKKGDEAGSEALADAGEAE